MKKVCHNEAQKIEKQGRKAVEAEFCWENEERKLFELYKEY